MKLKFKFTLRNYVDTPCLKCAYHTIRENTSVYCDDPTIREEAPHVPQAHIFQGDCPGFVPKQKKIG